MKQLITVSYNEYEKIMSRRKSKGLLIILSLILVGAGISYYYVENILNLTLMSGTRFPLWTLNLLMSFILPLFTAMIISDSVSGEYEDGTIRNLYALPVTRQTIYIGKVIGCLFYIAVMVSLVLGVGLSMSVLTDGFEVFSSIGMILLTHLNAIMVLGFVSVAVAFIALWSKSSSMTLVISVLLFFGMKTLGIFVDTMGNLLPTTIISSFDKLFSQNHLSLLVFLLAYYVIFIILGVFKFEKKDA